MSSHSAVGPALGYYYQAVFALISLFDSQNDNAFVSAYSGNKRTPIPGIGGHWFRE